MYSGNDLSHFSEILENSLTQRDILTYCPVPFLSSLVLDLMRLEEHLYPSELLSIVF